MRFVASEDGSPASAAAARSTATTTGATAS